jgi:uncharacterized protein YutE (UPF0331/DUF86 family)
VIGREKILLKLRDMKRYVDFLKSYGDTSVEGLRGDYLLRSAIERNFQLALELALDVGEMIISLENFRRPEDYRGVIEILGEEGVLHGEFAERFAPAAGFRNILVHRYIEVDLDELHRRLQELEDFDTFALSVSRFLKRKG